MPKKIPPPNYVTKKPVYPALKNLRQLSGEQDTFINLSEVALRLFEEIMKAGKDPSAFVNAICVHLNVNSSLGVDWNEVRANGHRFALTQVMTVAEAFLKRLAQEYRLYKGITMEWHKQVNGEQLDALDVLTENLGAAAKASARKYPEYHLIQYYGDVRNRTIHRTKKKTDAELNRLLGNHEKHFQDAYSTVPSPFEEIDYDDSLLLTRAVKYYANILNDLCDLRPKEIATLHLRLKSIDPKVDKAVANQKIDIQQQRHLPWVDSLRRMRSQPDKLMKALERLKLEYNLSASQCDEIMQQVEQFLQQDPTRKERKKAAHAVFVAKRGTKARK
jgi:hypothetical protein